MILKKKLIRYSTQSINSADINSVLNALKSDFLTEGPLINKFEKKLCKIVDSKYASAVSSASAGLLLACKALNLSKKSIIWTTPITFISSITCGLHIGAKIDLVDINEISFNIDIEKLKKKLIKAKKINKIPKILVVVHLGGNPCELESIKKLSNKYGFSVIEDASHALGSKYKNIKIGNAKYSDLVVFSFHPVKSITTGEGGAVLTNNKLLDDKIKTLRSHGIVRKKKELIKKNKQDWYYETRYLSSNYRLTSIQAALGLSQLKRLNSFIKKRNLLASNYEKKLIDLPLKFQKISSTNYSSRHLFIIIIDNKFRDKLYIFLKKKNIQTNLHYIPIYKHPLFKNKFSNKNFKIAEKYYKTALSIPLHFKLNLKQQSFIVNSIKKFFAKYR